MLGSGNTLDKVAKKGITEKVMLEGKRPKLSCMATRKDFIH